jgi:hypothetical protein
MPWGFVVERPGRRVLLFMDESETSLVPLSNRKPDYTSESTWSPNQTWNGLIELLPGIYHVKLSETHRPSNTPFIFKIQNLYSKILKKFQNQIIEVANVKYYKQCKVSI